jgi:hypothetical protein
MIDTTRLKKRIGSALADDNVGSAELFELISETEQAASAANAAAVQARTESEQLDADPKAAAQAISVAAIEARQLQRAAQQLQDMLPAVLNREAIDKYSVVRDKLQSESDAVEQKLTDAYLDAAANLIDVFKRAADFQQQAARELPSLPPGVATLRKFGIATTRLLEKVTLLDLDGEQLWPPPTVNFAVAAVAAMSFPSLAHGQGNPIGPGWELEEKDNERERDAKRYAGMTEEQERRQNAEEKQRFAAAQRR